MTRQAPCDALQRLVRRYRSAWNEPDVKQRYELLRNIWSADSFYIDPAVQVLGTHALVDYIGQVMTRSSGSQMVMTSESMRTMENPVRLGPHRDDGSHVSGGIDSAEVSEAGALRRVVGVPGDLPTLMTA